MASSFLALIGDEIMADISKISPDGGTTELNIKDATARSNIETLAGKIGAANGIAELDANGKVPSSQLPAYVDDVVEYDSRTAFPSTGTSGIIYIAKDTNKTYRWSGTTYVEISASLALGETESTAYRGDRGKAAYDHAYAKGSAFTSGLYKITTNAEGHVTAATAAVKSDITALGIPGQDTIYDDSELRGLISGLDAEIGDPQALKSDDKSSIVAAINETIDTVNEAGIDVLDEFSGSQAILDSSGNIILDSSSKSILDSQKGAGGLVNVVSNIVSWFKANVTHLIVDSGYTETEALYEILNS